MMLRLRCRIPHILKLSPGLLLLSRSKRPVIDLGQNASPVLALTGSALEARDMLFSRGRRIVSRVFQQRGSARMQKNPAAFDTTTLGCMGTDDTRSEKMSSMISTVRSNVRTKAYCLK